jgi:hypothetical protein
MENSEDVKAVVWRAINPLKPADSATKTGGDMLFNAGRIDAGRQLPEYYLVYLLLVELLGFRNSGKWEKTSWSVPVDLDGVGFVVEHRKFGVGVFAIKTDESKQQAQRIVALIKKGVKAARPFYEWSAQLAIQNSQINVSNVGGRLYERYIYFAGAFKTAQVEVVESKEIHKAKQKQRDLPIPLDSVKPPMGLASLVKIFAFPWIELERRAGWLALAAVDAFFAWTEHVFIHLAILQGRITTGPEVAHLTGAEWGEKFKAALNISEKVDKDFYDRLGTIRRQLRNFMAHGAFGKSGEAFTFHSGAGAVPVVFDGTARVNHP